PECGGHMQKPQGRELGLERDGRQQLEVLDLERSAVSFDPPVQGRRPESQSRWRLLESTAGSLFVFARCQFWHLVEPTPDDFDASVAARCDREMARGGGGIVVFGNADENHLGI